MRLNTRNMIGNTTKKTSSTFDLNKDTYWWKLHQWQYLGEKKRKKETIDTLFYQEFIKCQLFHPFVFFLTGNPPFSWLATFPPLLFVSDFSFFSNNFSFSSKASTHTRPRHQRQRICKLTSMHLWQRCNEASSKNFLVMLVKKINYNGGELV